MKSFICAKNCRLREFTDETYPQAGFCFARLLRDRDIRVNGARTGDNAPLKAGDEVAYYLSRREEELPSHREVYSDGEIYVADKFSGVSSEGLLSELSRSFAVYPVHRLDRNTEGLIVFARTEGAERELLKAFRERRVIKKYAALCKDGFASDEGVFKDYLVKDAAASKVRAYPSPVSGSAEAVTEYRVTERREGLALAEITLHTGRTHQIRAQMAFHGCPVLGDGKYGDKRLNALYGASRQRLVSSSISFFRLAEPLEHLNGKTFESGFKLSWDGGGAKRV